MKISIFLRIYAFMEIGFGKPEDGIRLHVTLGDNLKTIYFTSRDEIPENIAENLHSLQAEILEKIRAEISKMMSSVVDSLDALDEALSDSSVDDEILQICADCRKLSEKISVKLEKINAH